jgi:D-serine deaminase-like pyridoxal phosphate-dependent protein
MFFSSEYLDAKPIANLARLISAHNRAGSPARRRLSKTWESDLFVASRTSLMVSRTDAPRPVPMLSAGGSGWVTSAAALSIDQVDHRRCTATHGLYLCDTLDNLAA